MHHFTENCLLKFEFLQEEILEEYWDTVKLGDKECFDKEQIVVKELFTD